MIDYILYYSKIKIQFKTKSLGGIMINNTILQTTSTNLCGNLNEDNVTGITPEDFCKSLNEGNITEITPVDLCGSLNEDNVIGTTPDMIANFPDQETECWPSEIDTEFLVNVL
ncbi:MAG: hypothetical protein KAQ64_00760 [Candidatus Pacebacteria bacterium]|nr:hypothetical protein [Candidatus Paceibacterota bacterium]